MNSELDGFLFDAIEKYGVLRVGNNLNKYIEKDNFTSKITTKDIAYYLLSKYFNQYHSNYIIEHNMNNLSLMMEKRHLNPLDIDLVIYKEGFDKYYLLYCKNSSKYFDRYIKNLFLFDDRILYGKYNQKIVKKNINNIKINYAFVCLDWAKSKDFVLKNAKGNVKNTLKQTEVYLIDDDIYMGGCVCVLNNLENLNKVIGFSELTGKIIKFLD